MSAYTSDHLLYVFIGVKGGEKLIIIFKNNLDWYLGIRFREVFHLDTLKAADS